MENAHIDDRTMPTYLADGCPIGIMDDGYHIRAHCNQHQLYEVQLCFHQLKYFHCDWIADS